MYIYNQEMIEFISCTINQKRITSHHESKKTIFFIMKMEHFGMFGGHETAPSVNENMFISLLIYNLFIFQPLQKFLEIVVF